jgi:hypothetical protein
VVGSGNRVYYSAKVQFPGPSSGTMPSDNGHFLNWKKVIRLFAQPFFLHDFLYFVNYLIEEKDKLSRFLHCTVSTEFKYFILVATMNCIV